MILKRSILLAILTLSLIDATDTAAQSGGQFNYGRRWTAWTASERFIYLEGFRDGQGHTYFKVLGDLPLARREPLRLETFTMYDSDALGNVMTSLYADPANVYIQNEDMVYIARDKLSGKDVDAELRDARAMGATPR